MENEQLSNVDTNDGHTRVTEAWHVTAMFHKPRLHFSYNAHPERTSVRDLKRWTDWKSAGLHKSVDGKQMNK